MKWKKENAEKEKKVAKTKDQNDGRKKMEVSQKDSNLMNEGTSKKNKEVRTFPDVSHLVAISVDCIYMFVV